MLGKEKSLTDAENKSKWGVGFPIPSFHLPWFITKQIPNKSP